MKTNLLIYLTLWLLPSALFAQLVLTATPQINTVCNGVGCNYSGPSILINEVIISPSTGDGSIYGQGPGSTTQQAGEWIELYNPDKCRSIDISCYFLGNNAPDNGGDWGGGFLIPPGTIVPSRGFCIVRGVNASPVPSNLLVANGGKTIEIIVSSTQAVCIGGGYRLWFPNAGGWFAFYDRNGVPQDAISWNDQANSNLGGFPCNPNPGGSCPYTGQLASYNQIPANRKTYIDVNGPTMGLTHRRMPDGGNWILNSQGSPTYGTANGTPVPPPVITCNGQVSVNVTGGTPPYIYYWNDGQNQTTQAAIGLCAGTYCVTVSDAANHHATACATVNDYVPNVFLPSLHDTCLGSAPYPINGASPAGGTFNGQGMTGNMFNPVVAGLGSHSIIYSYYTADSCFNSDTSVIRVFSTPQVNLGPDSLFCDSINVVLHAGNPGCRYHWSTGDTLADIQITNPGTYWVRVFNQHCSDNDTVHYTLMPRPKLGNDTAYCNGSPVILSPGNSWNQYLWSTGSTMPSITVSQTGDYWVQVRIGNCIRYDTVHLQFKPNPVDFLGPDMYPCNTNSMTLYAGNPGGIFTWSTGAISDSISIDTSGTYGVHVDLNGCTGDYSVKVVFTHLAVSLGNDTTLCPGNTLALNAGNPGSTYQWSTGQHIPEIIVSQKGVYWVKVMQNGCIVGDTVIINYVPNLDLAPTLSLCGLDELKISSPVRGDSYLWSTGETTPDIIVKLAGLYKLYVQSGRCTLFDSTLVTGKVGYSTLFVPNCFTPNTDNINDYFTGKGEDIPYFHMMIFNRWGDLIFQTENMYPGWDGRYKGSPVPDGVYFYVIRYSTVCSYDQRFQKAGTLTVLR